MIRKAIKDSIAVKEKILCDLTLLDQIEDMAQASLTALSKGGKIIFAGNGGSFADAQHLSAEFISRYMMDRDSLPSVCLGANCSSMSAIGNDYGYERVFARELSALGGEHDIFIGISTSGNSQNIIEAIRVANEKGIQAFALTGETGGAMDGLCECLKVPSSLTGRIQESHIMIGHIVCGIVEQRYF